MQHLHTYQNSGLLATRSICWARLLSYSDNSALLCFNAAKNIAASKQGQFNY